jgi:hypothetical protein
MSSLNTGGSESTTSFHDGSVHWAQPIGRFPATAARQCCTQRRTSRCRAPDRVSAYRRSLPIPRYPLTRAHPFLLFHPHRTGFSCVRHCCRMSTTAAPLPWRLSAATKPLNLCALVPQFFTTTQRSRKTDEPLTILFLPIASDRRCRPPPRRQIRYRQ